MRNVLLAVGLCVAGVCADAADTVRVWTLQQCLDYAEEHNIEIRRSRNDYLSGVEDTKQARAARLLSLSGSVGQTYTNYPAAGRSEGNVYSGSYSLSAGMTLFQGGRLRAEVKRQEVQNRMDALAVDEARVDIRLAIVQAYMQCLYAAESVVICQSTAEASRLQRDRAEAMWQAGSISRVDFAQLESQYAGDAYEVVAAQANSDNSKLQLKQLLELGVTDEMALAAPDATEADVLRPLPPKAALLDTALLVMPEVRRGELAVEEAEWQGKSARAGYFPTVSLNAGIGSGHATGTQAEGSQMWNNLNENVGLTVSIPILSNRQNRTAVNKARLSLENSRLDLLDAQKAVQEDVETVYLDALSAQSQYVAAVEKEQYARQSYELTREQFEVGAKNTVELITAQNEWTAARQETLQAKYMALMSLKLLDIYQGKM